MRPRPSTPLSSRRRKHNSRAQLIRAPRARRPPPFLHRQHALNPLRLSPPGRPKYPLPARNILVCAARCARAAGPGAPPSNSAALPSKTNFGQRQSDTLRPYCGAARLPQARAAPRPHAFEHPLPSGGQGLASRHACMTAAAPLRPAPPGARLCPALPLLCCVFFAARRPPLSLSLPRSQGVSCHTNPTCAPPTTPPLSSAIYTSK